MAHAARSIILIVSVYYNFKGRLFQWHPGATENKRRAIPAYNPDLLARFCKESSILTKREMLPEIDMMDVGARQENLAVKGEPIMLQLCIVPAYALTVASESYIMGVGGRRGEWQHHAT